MPLYLIRWPNGDCSVVAATSREAAIDLLDNEVGNAEGVLPYPLKNFLVNFRLADDGALQLDMENPLGADTRHEIIFKAYPNLSAVLTELAKAEALDPKKARDNIREAVFMERTSVRSARTIAGTAEGRRLQKAADVPASKADRIVREARSKKRH